MYKTLLLLRLRSLPVRLATRTKFGKGKEKKTGTIVLAIVLFAYLFGMFGFIFYGMFKMLAAPFAAAGVAWLYFALFALMSFVLMFIFSVFSAKSQLFEAKDNELLLSMPIQPSAVLACRMTSLWLLNFVMELLVAIPAGIAWGRACELSPLGTVAFLVICLLLPFFSLAVSALFGWLLSRLSARVRNKSLFETVLSLAFLAAYFYGYSRVNAVLTRMAMEAQSFAGRLGGVAPLRWLGEAVANGDPLALLNSVLLLAVPFVLALLILSAGFVRTVTAQHGVSGKKYVMSEQKVRSASAALLGREWRRFLASSGYIMNAGLGAIFLLAAAVALVLKRELLLSVTAGMTQFEAYIFPACVLAIGILAGMSMPSCSSVSLEGKSVWVVQSLPARPADVLRAKLRLSLLIYLPAALVCALAVLWVFRPPLPLALLGLLVPAAYVVFAAELGLVSNLRHPNLDWENEMQVIKSGMAVLFAMLGSMGAVVVLGLGCLLLLSTELSVSLALLFVLLLLLLADVLQYRWIVKTGSVIFAAL